MILFGGNKLPIYCFVCPKCGYKFEIPRPIVESARSQFCPCGAEMRRDFAAQGINTGNKEYGKTKFSDSLAISPSQVEEHKRLFPDIPIDNQCRPGFDNYKQHDKYLEKCGFEKVSQKRRKRGRKIGGEKKTKIQR